MSPKKTSRVVLDDPQTNPSVTSVSLNDPHGTACGGIDEVLSSLGTARAAGAQCSAHRGPGERGAGVVNSGYHRAVSLWWYICSVRELFHQQ